MSDNPNALTYRHWFFVALLILINVIVFGCVILAVAEKMCFG